MRHSRGIQLALVASFAASFCAVAQASTVYTFRFDSGNNLYYDSTFTLGAQTGANSWGIASVDSSGVIEIGGQPILWHIMKHYIVGKYHYRVSHLSYCF